MIFYHCETPEGSRLAGTQADAKALDRKFEQVDVPTDKAGLMNFINLLYGQIGIPQIREVLRGPGIETLPMDGIECAQIETHYDVNTKPAFSQAKVDDMFEPQPEQYRKLTTDDVCHRIAEMSGADLGHVAHELAARFERLAVKS